MASIDTEWFLAQLKKQGMSQSDLARTLNVHRSAVTRMFSGERRMTVEEQDKIARILGVSVEEVSAHRMAVPAGFAEGGQAPFKTGPDGDARTRAELAEQVDDEDLPDHPIWGSMLGTIRVKPGVDLTAPMEFEWGGKLYNE